jgi:hypothetical protein
MSKEFYNNLINYVSKAQTTDAHNLLMSEVGKSLAKKRADFIELLNTTGVEADNSMSDVELVNRFTENLPNNKSLMISTAYMINKNNSFVNADGTEQISDNGVKLSYKIMNDFFTLDDENAVEFLNADGYSNAAGAIAGAIGAGAGLTDTIIKSRQKKKYGVRDIAEKQAESRSEILKSIAQQKMLQAQAAQKAAERKATTKKILLIGGVSVVLLGIIGFIIYKVKKGK